MRFSQTQQELLDNTVKYYSEDVNRRALNEKGNCLYKTDDGKKCAIGREVLFPEKLNKNLSVTGVFTELPKRLQKMELNFLKEIQHLHDQDVFWDQKGLSKNGIYKVESITKHYNLKNPLL